MTTDNKVNIHEQTYHSDATQITNVYNEPVIRDDEYFKSPIFEGREYYKNPILCEHSIEQTPAFSKTDNGIPVKMRASYTYEIGKDSAECPLNASINVARLEQGENVYHFQQLSRLNVGVLPKDCAVNLIKTVNEQFDKDIAEYDKPKHTIKEIISVDDIVEDVKKNGEEILGRPLTKKEVEYACTSMISDFNTHLYDKGYYDDTKEYTAEDEQADKDFFNETFYDNLKSVLPEVIDQIQNETQKDADDKAYKAHLKEAFPKDLKGFNRSNDINGNAVLKAFYKDGSTEMVRGGRVEEFYERYNKSWSDRNKSYKTVDGLRKSSLNNDKGLDR